MVILTVKRDQRNLFQTECSVRDEVGGILRKIVNLHNGILKIKRICAEMAELAEYGISVAPEMKGLLESQIQELKLVDKEAVRCAPEGGIRVNPDPVQRRTGRAPSEEMSRMLLKTVDEVKSKMSPDNTIDFSSITDCLAILSGAVSIVYPMKLPEYDPIRMELENREEIHDPDVILESEAALWFANKEMNPDKLMSVHVGKNEKTKVKVKLTTKKAGQPTSESWLSPETQRKLALDNYKRMEELKRLEKDEDDSYLDSKWADGNALKRQFQGINNISWK